MNAFTYKVTHLILQFDSVGQAVSLAKLCQHTCKDVNLNYQNMKTLPFRLLQAAYTDYPFPLKQDWSISADSQIPEPHFSYQVSVQPITFNFISKTFQLILFTIQIVKSSV